MVSFDNASVAFYNKSNKDLRWARFLFFSISSPFIVKLGKLLLKFLLFVRFPVVWFFKPAIYKQFIGSETLEGCEDVIKTLSSRNVKSILDYSFENGGNLKSYEDSFHEILKAVKYSSSSPHIAFSVFKLSSIMDTKLLAAVTSGVKLSKEEEERYSVFLSRVDMLCQAAHDAQKPILIDAEFSWYQGAIDQVVEVMMLKYNRDRAIVYNTIQLYRIDRLQYFFGSHKLAVDNDYILGVKLVRGAYMEIERANAEKKGYPSPIHECKQDTDRDFNEALKYIVKNIETISLFCGTHNEDSLNYLICLMDSNGVPPDDPRIFISQLYGMSDSISFNFAESGYNVAKYIPYGPVQLAIPYLVRRIEENTSVMGQTGRELKSISVELKRRRKEKIKN